MNCGREEGSQKSKMLGKRSTGKQQVAGVAGRVYGGGGIKADFGGRDSLRR